MEITYRPYSVWVAVVDVCCILLIIPFSFGPLDPISCAVIAYLAFTCLDISFGTYITVDQMTLCRTDYFIWKKCINIQHINSIAYRPTWVFAGRYKSLIIFDTHGTSIQLSYPAFKERVISKLIFDLTRMNPSIRLDEAALELIQKYASS